MDNRSQLSQFAAFLSYVRLDDEDSGITKLRRALSAELRMQTGEEVLIFQDRENILVGERWRERIQSALDGTTLLIATITPSFFRSAACREELSKFFEREDALGRDDLVIPILYVSTPALTGDDLLATRVTERQYVDWRQLRFEEENSSIYRREVAQLAEQIASAIERSRNSLPPPDLGLARLEIDDAGPGFIELVAEAEDAMPRLTQTTEDFASAMSEVGSHAQTAVAEMTSARGHGSNAGAAVIAIGRLKNRLEGPVTELENLAADYVDQLETVDGGIQAMVNRVPDLESEEDIDAAKTLLETLVSLANTAGSSIESIRELQTTLKDIDGLSSNLRPTLRRMSRAASRIVPSAELFDEWRDKLEAALNGD